MRTTLPAFLMILLLAGCMTIPPTPPSMPPIDRTLGPNLPPNPGQADLGSTDYWFICMACHGDRGQGLTEEWRTKWGPEEMNCWQSKCHASNHPPEGFDLPRISPPVIGAGALARYKNAQELFEKIYLTMPWWKPGLLTEEQAWKLTAYLLKAQGVLPENVTLSASNAAVFPLHPASSPARNPQAGVLLVAGLIIAAAFTWATQHRLERRP